MCVLNEACEEEAYKKLVKALCGEHSIPLIQVGDGKLLGEWAGLCELPSFDFLCATYSLRGRLFRKGLIRGLMRGPWAGDETGVLDREGNARKVVNCSCVVIRDWGEESQERAFLMNYFATERRG